jgi:hypothetical protein
MGKEWIRMEIRLLLERVSRFVEAIKEFLGL